MNMLTQLPSRARYPGFGQNFHLVPYFVCANRINSYKTVCATEAHLSLFLLLIADMLGTHGRLVFVHFLQICDDIYCELLEISIEHYFRTPVRSN